MKKLFKWLGIGLGLTGLAIGLFFLSMRFSDGPLEIISGGPFKTGELSAAPADWGYLKERDTLQ